MINEEILEKYEKNIIKNIDKENVSKIIGFLIEQNCDYYEELLEDYLDLFVFEAEEFKQKFNYLNNKYNNKFLEKAKLDMNLFEQFY